MVNFCNLDFNHRLVNPETNEQRKELYDIFGSIFSKEKTDNESLIKNPF
jgi:hypothetical protein